MVWLWYIYKFNFSHLKKLKLSIYYLVNDDSISNPREHLEVQPTPFFGNSSVPNSSGYVLLLQQIVTIRLLFITLIFQK